LKHLTLVTADETVRGYGGELLAGLTGDRSPAASKGFANAVGRIEAAQAELKVRGFGLPLSMK
jgi:hypothetical protein